MLRIYIRTQKHKKQLQLLLLGSAVSITGVVGTILYGGAYLLDKRLTVFEERINSRIDKFEESIIPKHLSLSYFPTSIPKIRN